MRRVTVRAVGRLAIAPGREAGNAVDSYPYVPGWVLRGALAARWIKENGPPHSSGKPREFLDLFERGAVAFGPLLPEGAFFEPTSLFRCKHRSQPGCHEDGVDLADVVDPHGVLRHCGHCGRPRELAKGQLAGAAPLVETVRTALRADETAAEGMLFSRRAIREHTVLTGVIHGDHPWLDQVRDAPIQLGGRRSVGGAAKITIDAPQPSPFPDVRADGTVVLRLRSPAVVLDRFGRNVLAIPPSELHELGDLTITSTWLRSGVIGGWNAAMGVPKPQERVLEPGSTLVVRPSRPPEPAALARLETRGIGVRNQEGFGWVEVNPARRVAAPAHDVPSGRQVDPLVRDLADRIATAHRLAVVDLLKDREVALEASPNLQRGPLPSWTNRLPAAERQPILDALALDGRSTRDLAALLDGLASTEEHP